MHYQPTRNNQVTSVDLEALWSTLTNMFEVTRSAARPDVSVRNLFVFSHSNALGNAPARTLLDSIKITKTTDKGDPDDRRRLHHHPARRGRGQTSVTFKQVL